MEHIKTGMIFPEKNEYNILQALTITVPRVISGKIIFSAKVPSKCPLKLAISEGIFHLCEKNLQKGVGKYRFPGFIGRGTIILKILPQRCPLLPVSVQSM